ncbi:PDZ domain-containing protein [Novosphingobium mangrovi (ex Hu et al. 2023)]|uniref:PDZ domain-containing protein n=1 Tax=Novosphingobium mangrovi (ex Hu et al. 2023) TaxID=2930094 RepID=A0ABT0ACA5_9SPHN|nr:PDZ domain-containing protein [Novosphingobium mangrovi (ex Hu et al. 2023)]MCJ1960831.1 PDZ domain-containing protein [Novosphingobium mangrovi (ex Hu et al. 2023)]
MLQMRMCRTTIVLKTARLLSAAVLALAALSQGHATDSGEPQWPVAIRGSLARMGTLEYRLKRAAPGLCIQNNTATGMTIDYIEAYAEADRQIVTALTGLDSRPQVIGVAPGSPAFEAGVRAGDDIVEIDGTPFAQLRDESDNPALLADELTRRLADTPASQDITLTLARPDGLHSVRFRGEQLCAARFVVKTDNGLAAYSDPESLAISEKYFTFARNDDELAIVTAHEFAHIVAQDKKASGLRQRRAMEDRADILGVDIMRCAGYDPERGLGLWEHYNKRDWLKWFRAPTHRNMSDRIKRMRAHITPPKSCPPQIPSL